MSLAELARFIAAEPDFDMRWRLVVEFLKEYHREPAGTRQRLLADAPGSTGDERWDVLFAGLAEHLAMRDGKDAPDWSASRGLRRFWFPFDTPGARAQALVGEPSPALHRIHDQVAVGQDRSLGYARCTAGVLQECDVAG